MVKIHLRDTAEFEEIFRNKTLKVTTHIVEGIQEAMQQNAKTADLFEISFDDVEMVYEISLPQNQWATALQSCLDLYHENDMGDECIDTWKLLEAAKLW